MKSIVSAIIVGVALSIFSLVTIASAATGPKVTHQYGSDATYNLLDSYSPPGSGHPILIFVHGGGWHVGSKDNHVNNKKEGLIGNRDYVLVSVEYRNGYITNWEGQANDIADAIKWVHSNASLIGGDSNNIFLMGHSSGAHMSALVAGDNSYGVRTKLRGIALLDSGDYDVVAGYNYCTGSTCVRYGAFWDNYNTSSMSAGSPVNHADNHVFPPAVIVHRFTPNKVSQATGLRTSILTGGQPNALLYESFDSHSQINQDMGLPAYAHTAHVSDFFNILVFPYTITMLEDDFENYNVEQWSSNAFAVSGVVYEGSQALKCDSTSTHIISRGLDTSSLDSMNISFFYRDSGIDPSDDVYLQFYNGSTYVNQVELGTSAPNNTWTEYSTTLHKSSHPSFFTNNFRMKVDCAGIDASENFRLDKVLITGS